MGLAPSAPIVRRVQVCLRHIIPGLLHKPCDEAPGASRFCRLNGYEASEVFGCVPIDLNCPWRSQPRRSRSPLPVPDGAARAAELDELSRRAAIYATRARGDGTRRAYRSAWQQYAAWCATLAREPLGADPDTIAMYVVRLADQGRAVSSIRVVLAAIRTAHLLAGRSIDLRHPRLAMVLEGVTRSKGIRPRRQAAPAVPGLLRLMLAKRPAPALPLGTREATVAREAIVARERAMLLLGFGAALRRAELVGLALGDLERVPDKGLLLTIGRSKTDQHGKGQRVAVCANPAEPGVCPAAALQGRGPADQADGRARHCRGRARRRPV